MIYGIRSFLLGIALCSCTENSELIHEKKIPTWCVANTGAPLDQLQAFLDYGCHVYECSPIQTGGSCFEPNVLYGHASWILDKFYREVKSCQKGLGFITTTNPYAMHLS
ncbi:Glucan endo-1,3-beta-D-glucosidase [Handroanthus impetiginosus]|uniref:Glucan endo-1,3-beta-D-glucosidase n=1 Tax=Handroanthus impetiginosus TaxID=429701 RepID=A0A2G9HJB5_9LAMI|nr:Glucan endo-1,3-beta-D-glucosidase [Handroanthus impetiginosus]